MEKERERLDPLTDGQSAAFVEHAISVLDDEIDILRGQLCMYEARSTEGALFQLGELFDVIEDVTCNKLEDRLLRRQHSRASRLLWSAVRYFRRDLHVDWKTSGLAAALGDHL